MARLSDDVIDKIKSEVSLLRLVESQGYQTKKKGKDYVLCCPFHKDDTPSLVITPSKNLFNCFGCDAQGTVIDWVMKTQGVSFRFACELLQKDLGLLVESGTETRKDNTTTKLTPPLAANADSQTALKQVIDYYHETFKQAPEAHEYLKKRGLDHPELVERFRLGFANRTLGYRLPEKNRKSGKELRGKLQDIGILRSSGHEHLNGCLVVPIIDENGIITEVYGRKILGNRLRKGTAQHLYLPGQHEGVWNVEALKASKEIILCEALLDAMTFWCHGFRNVTSSYGTSGFTASHLGAFKQYGTERILIAYDRDESGNKAAEQLAEKLQAEGIDCYRILLPKGMDVNEYAQQVQPANKSLELVIRKAEFMGAGKATKQTITTEIVDEETGEIIEVEVKETPEIPLPSVATVAPEPAKTVDAEVAEHETVINLGDRRYRIRGLQKNMSYDQLKVNVLVNLGELFYVDTLDIYSARHRNAYIKQAAIELGVKADVIKKDLGRVLLKLEELQEQNIKKTLEPEEPKIELTQAEQQAALDLLKSPNLLSRITEDFKACGVIGEETNALTGYLASVSRKLDKPLAVIIQSTSAAGKSSLMEAILAMMPSEERVQYSAMTGQSLFYMNETGLKNKILAIAESEGAENAAYALKLLQSEGKVTIASTGKDATTGNLMTQEYSVEGPVCLLLTTTAIDIDPELMNRCLVLTVNETREQTAAIHDMQRSRQTLEGLLAEEDKKDIINLHNNAQRLLKPLLVANPFANELTFLSDKTRTRRDHMKYLTLIRSIALLHQYQRPTKTVNHKGKQVQYIEVTHDDILVANQLAHQVLGHTLDELPPQTRKLLKLIHSMVSEQCQARDMEQCDYRFSRRDIRDYTGWSDGQLKIHCARLTELEYLLVHRGGRGQSLVYELLYDGDADSGDVHLMGLIDPQKLNYDAEKLGQKEQKTVPSQGQVSTKLGSSQVDETLVVKGFENKKLNNPINSITQLENNTLHHTETVNAVAEV